MMPVAPWSLVYADGAANVYRFAADGDGVRFAYEPVTPERSSTGRYSGGEPVELRLAHDDPRLAALWRHVAALEADGAQHVAARMKGDGAFTVETVEGTRQFLVARSATRELEALLVDELRCSR
jgi:hypothetical protein